MFSFVPRCHGLCGSAKYIGAFSSASICRNSENSEPLSRLTLLTGTSFSNSVRTALVIAASRPANKPGFQKAALAVYKSYHQTLADSSIHRIAFPIADPASFYDLLRPFGDDPIRLYGVVVCIFCLDPFSTPPKVRFS